MSTVLHSFVLSILFLLASCSGQPGIETPGYLTKEQVLKEDREVDYFELQNKVYVTNIDWIEEIELTQYEVIGEIIEGKANVLPVGAKIIAPKERRDILIVNDSGTEKRYLLMIGE